MSLSASFPVKVGGTLGITFSAFFVGSAVTVAYLGVPTILLQAPTLPLPPPVNAPNAASPTSVSSEKPVAKPQHLARQWQNMYDVGKPLGMMSAVLGTGSFLYAMRHLPSGSRLQQRLLLVAATLTMGILPYTLTVMSRTNNELHRRADAATRGEDEESLAKTDAKAGTVESYQTHDLIRWWAKLHIV